VRPPWTRVIVGVVLTTMTALILGMGLAVGQESEGLTPSFGGGRLTITGGSFRAGEQITLTVQAGGTRQQFTAIADARGRFQLATDLVLRPGESVQLEARGNQGTTQAAMTSVPGGLPLPPTPGAGQPPGVGSTVAVPIIPEADGLVLLGSGLVTLSALAGLQARRRRNE